MLDLVLGGPRVVPGPDQVADDDAYAAGDEADDVEQDGDDAVSGLDLLLRSTKEKDETEDGPEGYGGQDPELRDRWLGLQ